MSTVVEEAQPETSGLSRRRILQGVAWATPAVLIATALPAAAGSQDTVTTGLTTQTAQALFETNVGGGSGWNGPPSNVTLQLGYRLAIPAGWPQSTIATTAWVFTLRNAAGTVVGTASGTAVLTAASSQVNVLGNIQVTAVGTYSATYVVTATPYQSGGVSYQAANLVSLAPYTVQVARLNW